MESQKKKSVEPRADSIFRDIFRIRFEVITTMIVQSTTFIADLFKIQSSYSSTSSHGKPEKKNLLNLAAEHSIFRVLFGIRFEVIITMIVQSTTLIPPPNPIV